MEETSCNFIGRVFSPVKETRSFLTGGASTSSTKLDQAPQLGQRPRYLGEWYSQDWQTKVDFFLAISTILDFYSFQVNGARYHLAVVNGFHWNKLAD